MNTSPQTPLFRNSCLGITAFEVLVAICAGVILFLLLVSSMHRPHIRGRMADQLNNGRSMYLGLRNYASETRHEGLFPMYADSDAKTGLFTNSSEALEALLPRYLDDKRPMNSKWSAWCRQTKHSAATANQILPGENDWCYVRGLTEKSNARWPLLANAFVPGTTRYVKDQSKPGGVWKGANAIVVWAGGSAEIVETKETGDTFFVKRSDKPALNAFEADGEWLAGENIKLLYPADPQSAYRP